MVIKNDDFAGWYEQFVVAATERHLTVQIVSSEGYKEDLDREWLGGMFVSVGVE